MPNGQGLKSYKLPPVMGVAVTGWIALKASPNSDETLLNEVFAPQVRIEVPAGASLDHPGKAASYIMSQVARTAPGIKSILTADAGNN
jgi:hypothetical protein